jgi:hypothetical protein
VTATKHRVALVAAADHMRAALAEYLKSSGFDVYECDDLEVPSAFGALVVIRPYDTSDETLVDEVRAWIKSTKSQRVVVVTSKPTALKTLVAAHNERLYVLPAPAFGWELVDALRSTEPPRPRGA